MDPKTAKVTEKGGLKLTKAEEGTYTTEVEFEQKLILVSELEGYDKIEKEVEIGAEDKTEDLKMSKSKVSISTNCWSIYKTDFNFICSIP